MATLIQIRRDTQANWTSNDPVLAVGELAYSTDQFKLKVGNGSSNWSQLDYINATPTEITSEINSAISTLIGEAPETLDTLNELAAAINDDASFYTTVNNSISNAIDAIDTDDIEEGATNLYFTDQRAIDAVANGSFTTDVVEEGASNLYFTDQRALDATSAAYDASGSASTAESNANSYTDGEISSLDSSLKSYADTAESDAITSANGYTDSEVASHEQTTSGVHGVTGDVVGTTDSQTISNKTLGSNLIADSNKITGLGNPTQSGDAANKAYVDSTAQGLRALPAAEALSNSNIAGTFSSANNTITADSNVSFPEVDGVTLSQGENIFLVNQTNAWENGSYVLTAAGEAGVSPWILTRCDFCNETAEIAGSFEFVTSGTTYGKTGWVATVPDGFTLNATDGSGDISWVQFSGAGTYDAGNGLEINGNTFSIDTDITATKTYVDGEIESIIGLVVSSAAKPSSPGVGDAWFDTVTGNLYIYSNDGDSSQWVQV